MGENWFQRELFSARRLLFNILFYGSHLALFAYGWYSQVWRKVLETRIISTNLTLYPGNEQEAQCPERAWVFRVDLSWCWARPGL